MPRRLWLAPIVFVLIAACRHDTSPSSAAAPLRVVVLTATAGFRHDSIPVARDTIASLGTSSGAFAATATEDAGSITATSLTATDVLVFALTTGELPFSVDQKQAIVAFVMRGGGFVGFHSAADTLYDWPEYGSLVGAYFKEHPWTQEASVRVEDPSDPTTTGLGSSFRINEEFYAFRSNPRPSVHVLLALDASSVGATGDYPLAWSHAVGAGRAYYNALGHFPATWQDARFQRQIVAAIGWAGGRN